MLTEVDTGKGSILWEYAGVRWAGLIRQVNVNDVLTIHTTVSTLPILPVIIIIIIYPPLLLLLILHVLFLTADRHQQRRRHHNRGAGGVDIAGREDR